jgi:hypothetical protein
MTTGDSDSHSSRGGESDEGPSASGSATGHDDSPEKVDSQSSNHHQQTQQVLSENGTNNNSSGSKEVKGSAAVVGPAGIVAPAPVVLKGRKMESVTRIVQVANIAPQATRDQMQALFGYIGKIEDLRLYPTM